MFELINVPFFCLPMHVFAMYSLFHLHTCSICSHRIFGLLIYFPSIELFPLNWFDWEFNMLIAQTHSDLCVAPPECALPNQTAIWQYAFSGPLSLSQSFYIYSLLHRWWYTPTHRHENILTFIARIAHGVYTQLNVFIFRRREIQITVCCWYYFPPKLNIVVVNYLISIEFILCWSYL